MNDPTPVPTLSLRQIAAWQIPELLNSDASKLPFVAKIPSLQRGAIWKAGQIELLWDSIFRGFPVGALVVSEYLMGQKSRRGAYADPQESDWHSKVRERHLIDGQQRCNAIALGYVDPFA